MTYAAMDFTKPNVARVYDYLLGGFESYEADREQAAELLLICPALGVVALENRYFLARAVAWAAGQGVTQFVDLGAGAPMPKAGAGVLEDIHLTAQAASPSARVPYVDHAPADVEGFLADLELVPPGVVAAQNWRGGWDDAPSAWPDSVYVLAGMARIQSGEPAP